MSTDVPSTRPFRARVELHQYRSTYGRGPRSACIEGYPARGLAPRAGHRRGHVEAGPVDDLVRTVG
jgi:hypothetical protein